MRKYSLHTFVAIDPCDSNPCINGDCVKIDHDTYKCMCPPEFTGTNCDAGWFLFLFCLHDEVHILHFSFFTDILHYQKSSIVMYIDSPHDMSVSNHITIKVNLYHHLIANRAIQY